MRVKADDGLKLRFVDSFFWPNYFESLVLLLVLGYRLLDWGVVLLVA